MGHDDSERDDHARLVKRVRQRQIWTILFAIMLASIASFATAQSPSVENRNQTSGMELRVGFEYFSQNQTKFRLASRPAHEALRHNGLAAQSHPRGVVAPGLRTPN